MTHEDGHFTSHDGCALYFQRWVPVDAPKANLAVLHGMGEHSRRYRNFALWFKPLGYAVHAFDHRGHGKSPGPRGHIKHWAEFREDVRIFLEEVRGRVPDAPTFLVGHSLGGLIVLDYSLHYGEELSGVVASGPALARGEGVSPLSMFAAKLLSPVLPWLRLGTGLAVEGLSRDGKVVQRYREDPLVHGWGTPRLGAEISRTMHWALAHADAWPQALPLLIVHGEADPICPAYASERFFHNAGAGDKTRYVYPGYLHETFNEIGREQVLGDIQAWLEQHL